MQSVANRYATIGYSVPASPSRLRVYVWRKLRQIGAENIKPGLAVLPENSENRAQLRALASSVREMGGEASVYTLIFDDPAEERSVVALFAQRAVQTLEKLEQQLRATGAKPVTAQVSRLASQVKKAINHYEKTGAQQDPSVREEFEGALRSVLSAIRTLPIAFADELRDLLK